jgi:hypothetical protein
MPEALNLTGLINDGGWVFATMEAMVLLYAFLNGRVVQGRLFDRSQGQIDKILPALTSVTATLKDATQLLSQVSTRLAALEARMTGTEKNLANLDGDIGDMRVNADLPYRGPRRGD